MHSTEAVDRLRQVIRLQHKALSTEATYVYWLRRYIHALQAISDDLPSEKKLERFLTDLAIRENVAATTQNQAFNAVVFFYAHVLEKPLGDVNALRAKRPVRERHAPSVADTQALLQNIRDVGGYPTNLVARLLYGCGLRVSEPLSLRVKDVDLERGRLWIRGAKGGNDRVVRLPMALVPDLNTQLRAARLVWQLDKENRTPFALPHRLARKYPEYQFSWRWAWLFPAHFPCRDPRTNKLVRFRMHEANLQRAVKYARRKLGLSILPHELRHGYATHYLERGTSPRAIQQAMGHKSLETTMGYLHAEAQRREPTGRAATRGRWTIINQSGNCGPVGSRLQCRSTRAQGDIAPPTFLRAVPSPQLGTEGGVARLLDAPRSLGRRRRPEGAARHKNIAHTVRRDQSPLLSS